MSSTHWHAINPSTRPLTLTVLEITPTSLTLSLSLSSTSRGSISPTPLIPAQKRKKRNRRHPADSDDDLTAVEGDDESHGPQSSLPGSWPILDSGETFKDILSQGVVVTVNSVPWPRITATVIEDEETEEEVISEVDQPAGAEGEGDGGEGGTEGMTRRRPRKARFSLSASDAVSPGERKAKIDGLKKEKERAIVVVYGLTAGKAYEVELTVPGVTSEADSIGRLFRSFAVKHMLSNP